ncbi:hypothetical protein C7B61_12035 [filamentous cyanobacterium CCP1]|jgi:hypothetical protein|nr:hypothetical protein C7B76_24200 [filamentous cyanobacterium CCP2]PSB64621.1 hypothetical protein C7B61_12035 [filamentous cyanobacterium CCP1]
MKLGELLVRKKLISQEQLNQALELQASMHCQLGELLVDRSLISAEHLTRALQEQYWRNNGFWVIG